MQSGNRLSFQFHVLGYFRTATASDKAWPRHGDGRVVETENAVGDTRLFHCSRGGSMAHSLENTGITVLCCTAVEFLVSANASLR